MLDRAETMLHDFFGDAYFWKARRSMRYVCTHYDVPLPCIYALPLKFGTVGDTHTMHTLVCLCDPFYRMHAVYCFRTGAQAKSVRAVPSEFTGKIEDFL